MEKNNFFVKTEIERGIRRVAELLSTGVFDAPVLQVFQESVFTELMIRLNDLMQKLKQLGKRISFTDDIGSVGDITDLINKIRNAVCHIESGEHLLDKERKVKFTFNVAYGKANVALINGKQVTSDYEDDICFFFGEHKIYLKRHIIRALQEAQEKYRELYGPGSNPSG